MLVFRRSLDMESGPESIDEVAGVSHSLTDMVRSERGCSATHLVRKAVESHTLTGVEEWRREKAFEHRVRSPELRRLLAVMEPAAVVPRVEVDNVSSLRGFDVVEEMLNRSDGLKPAREMETT